MAKTEGVPLDLIDKILAGLAPARAVRRYTARVALAHLTRAYDAGAKGRGTSGWVTRGQSADAEIHAAGGILRDRMRDLVRNDPLAAQAVQVLVNNIIGPGIRPRAKTGNKSMNRKIDQLFSEFCRTCDWHGHTDFYGLQALAVREMVEGGECLAIQRFQPRGNGRQVPLRIELREGDHLDDAKMSTGSGAARVSQGIEYDESGAKTAFWMFPDHPGGVSNMFSRRFTSERMPADRVAHLFERQRVQNRGVPWGVAAMRGLRDFGDWHRSELVRKKTEAALVAFVIGDDFEAGGIAPSQTDAHGNKVTDANGNPIEAFQPGMVAYANGATDVKFNNPSASGGIYEWSRTQMMIIAAGFRVPYALMSGDFSNSNFSSNRAGLNEFRRMVDQMQWQTVIPMFCQPVWDWFIAAAQLQGQLPIDLDSGDVEWAPPRFESVNPKQDVEADAAEVRAGFATRSQKIAARGYDPEEIMEEWQADAKDADDRALVFDTDPRRVAKAGSAQPDVPDLSSAGATGDKTE